MLNHRLAKLAFRNRAASTVVATTGSTTLGANAQGYTRASGSFVTDGFYVGMEVVPTGFPQIAPGIVTAVTATLLSIQGGRTVAAADTARSLTVGLPTLRAYENKPLTTIGDRPFIAEQWVPSPGVVTTIPARSGRHAETGYSIWNWYGIAGVETDALDVQADALLARFAPWTPITLSNGVIMMVRTKPAPFRSQIINVEGRPVVTISIPWEVSTRNVVAA
jgi:hypothetical protein